MKTAKELAAMARYEILVDPEAYSVFHTALLARIQQRRATQKSDLLEQDFYSLAERLADVGQEYVACLEKSAERSLTQVKEARKGTAPSDGLKLLDQLRDLGRAYDNGRWEWRVFVERFAEIGDSIGVVTARYDDVIDSFRSFLRTDPASYAVRAMWSEEDASYNLALVRMDSPELRERLSTVDLSAHTDVAEHDAASVARALGLPTLPALKGFSQVALNKQVLYIADMEPSVFNFNTSAGREMARMLEQQGFVTLVQEGGYLVASLTTLGAKHALALRKTPLVIERMETGVGFWILEGSSRFEACVGDYVLPAILLPTRERVCVRRDGTLTDEAEVVAAAWEGVKSCASTG